MKRFLLSVVVALPLAGADIYHISGHGQSLCIGTLGNPALSTTQPYTNKLIATAGTVISPLIETTLESPFSAMANQITSEYATWNTITETRGTSDGSNNADKAINDCVGGNAYIFLDKTAAAWDSGTTYGASGITTSPVMVSYTDGITYLSLQASNTNHIPSSSPTWWTPAPYYRWKTIVAAAPATATAAGFTYHYAGAFVVHGESDLENWNATGTTATVAQYEGALHTWQTNLQADALSITGAGGTIPMLVSQMSSWTVWNTATATTTGTATSGSTALVVASGTGIAVGQIVTGAGIAAGTYVTVVAGTAVTLSANTTGSLSGTTVNFWGNLHGSQPGNCNFSNCTGSQYNSVPIAQIQAARDYPGAIFFLGPKYQYTYADTQHLVNTGYQQLGELAGKAWKQIIINGNYWTGLVPRQISISGATITLRLWVPAGSVTIDTSTLTDATGCIGDASQLTGSACVSAGDFWRYNGFEFWDSEGTSKPYVSGVSAASADTLTITLSATPSGTNQRLRYAYSGWSHLDVSPSTGPHGNIRDSDSTTGVSSGAHLYDWLATFDDPVTFSWAPPTVGALFPGPGGFVRAK